LKLIEAGALDNDDVGSLAARLEIGERQLRRLFAQHLGAAPITVAQTRRVLLAKQLIAETSLSMIDVALASGFGSVRRFNETFQRMYGRPPRELKRQTKLNSPAPGISILLPYRAPYDWENIIKFLAARAIAGVEFVTPECYSRTIEFDNVAGSLQVTHARKHSALRVTVRIPRLDWLPTIVARIRRIFDLGADPIAIASALSRDPKLAPLVAARPGLRVPGGWDGFEIAIRAVLGQQITVKSATRLASRIATTLGRRPSEQDDSNKLTHVFPQPERFTATSLSGFGLTRARVAALVGVANAALADDRLFSPRRNLDETVARLRELPGIGAWTAQYIAMRAIGESDAFMPTDAAIQRSAARFMNCQTTSKLLSVAERWRPWRAYAMLHLWTAESQFANTSQKDRYYAVTT
jgi:AraC family transcriptional regulator of adaptative response / DNA-3-methyladenine glycosylase II